VPDMGTRRIPMEIKSAETVATDFFDGLDDAIVRIKIDHDAGSLFLRLGAGPVGELTIEHICLRVILNNPVAHPLTA